METKNKVLDFMAGYVLSAIFTWVAYVIITAVFWQLDWGVAVWLFASSITLNLMLDLLRIRTLDPTIWGVIMQFTPFRAGVINGNGVDPTLFPIVYGLYYWSFDWWPQWLMIGGFCFVLRFWLMFNLKRKWRH